MNRCWKKCWTPFHRNSVTDASTLSKNNEDGANEKVNEEWMRAAFFIDDALHKRGGFGRAKASTLPKYRQRCFLWVASNKTRYVYFIVIFLHCFLAFFEPPQTTVHPGQTSIYVMVLHVFCLLCYAADLTLHLLFYGCQAFWNLVETRRCRGEFVLFCFFTVDFIILVAQEITALRLVAPFRCFRFSMIICKSKSCEHIFTVTLLVCKKLAMVFIMFMAYLLTFSSIGVHMYSNDYHFIGCDGSNCTDTWKTNPDTGAFDNIGMGFIHIFGLLTTENYPTIMIPAYDRTQANVAFFAICTYLGNFILLAVLLAIIVNNYWKTAKVMIKAEREQQRECLAHSWNIIDPGGVGKACVESEALFGVLKCLNKKYSKDEICEILHYLDFNDDGYVDALEWTIHLCDALRYEFILDNKTRTSTNESQYRLIIAKFISSKVFEYGIGTLIILYWLVFAIHWYKMSFTDLLVIQIIRTLITGIFLVEFGMRLVEATGRRSFSKTDIAQYVLIVINALAVLAWYFQRFVPLTLIRQDYYFGLMSTVATLAMFVRLPLHLSILRKVNDIILACVPVMATLISVLMVVFYAYSILGLEAFYGRRKPSSSEGVDPSSYSYGCGLGFETFGCSCLLILQILVTNDWTAMQSSVIVSVQSEWTAIFFISCFVILNYIMNNLLVAIAIEAYNKLGNTIIQPKEADDGGSPPDDNENEVDADKEGDIQFITSPPSSPRRGSLTAEIHFRQRAAGKSKSRSDYLNNTVSFALPDASSENDRPANDGDEPSDESKEATRVDLHEKMMKRKRSISSVTKVVMAYRKKPILGINLHVDDVIEEIFERKEFIHGRTSRGRTGWFPAECIEVKGPRRKVSKAESDRGSKSGRELTRQPTTRSLGRTKIVRKTDWKRDILGDITVMNDEELLRINRHINVDMLSLRKSELDLDALSESSSDAPSSPEAVIPVPSTKIITSVPATTIIVEESIDEDPDEPNDLSADSNKLFVPSAPRPKTVKTKKLNNTSSDEPPDWAKKFLQLGSFALRETSRPPSPDQKDQSEQDLLEEANAEGTDENLQSADDEKNDLKPAGAVIINIENEIDKPLEEPSWQSAQVTGDNPQNPVLNVTHVADRPIEMATLTRQETIDETHQAVFKFDFN